MGTVLGRSLAKGRPAIWGRADAKNLPPAVVGIPDAGSRRPRSHGSGRSRCRQNPSLWVHGAYERRTLLLALYRVGSRVLRDMVAHFLGSQVAEAAYPRWLKATLSGNGERWSCAEVGRDGR